MANSSRGNDGTAFRRLEKNIHVYELKDKKHLSLLIEVDAEPSKRQRRYHSYIMMEQYGITVDNGEYPCVDTNGNVIDLDTAAGQIIQELFEPVSEGYIVRNIDRKIIELKQLHDAIFTDEFPLKTQWARSERMYYKNIVGFKTAKNVTQEAITDLLTDYDITFYADNEVEFRKGYKVTYLGIKSEDLPYLKKRFTTTQKAKNEFECTINNFDYTIFVRTVLDFQDIMKELKNNGIEPLDTTLTEVYGELRDGHFVINSCGLIVRYKVIVTISPNDRKKFENIYQNYMVYNPFLEPAENRQA